MLIHPVRLLAFLVVILLIIIFNRFLLIVLVDYFLLRFMPELLLFLLLDLLRSVHLVQSLLNVQLIALFNMFKGGLCPCLNTVLELFLFVMILVLVLNDGIGALMVKEVGMPLLVSHNIIVDCRLVVLLHLLIIFVRLLDVIVLVIDGLNMIHWLQRLLVFLFSGLLRSDLDR